MPISSAEESVMSEETTSEKPTPEAPAAAPPTEAIKEETNNKEKTTTRLIQAVEAKQQQHNEDLARYVDNSEPLLVGLEKYTMIKNSSNTANNKGVMILIPDWQQPATTPKAIHYLQKALPNHGWATMTIQPMDKPAGYPSTAIKAVERKEENEKILTEYKKKLSAIYQAIIEKAKLMPGIFVVISEGNHAALFIDILADENEQPHAMIMLSSYRELPSENTLFSQNLAMSEFPVLDLFLKKDNRKVLTSAMQRRKQTNQEMKVDFRQRKLNNFYTGYYPQEILLKEIKGWLKSMGW